jgi:glycosyltransferase involved in cell wall biosynthesis
MLTYNAPGYVDLTIRSLAKNTFDVSYELIVLDNASDQPTRDLVQQLYSEGLITKLKLLDYNSLFSRGNNLAAKLSSPDATHFLLLNSDVKIRNPTWLSNLLDVHKRGITAYGLNLKPSRIDGYCALIDADLYRENLLDETHQWTWSVAKLQARLLRSGHSVQGFFDHERYLHHFGGKSGRGYVGASGLVLSEAEVTAWFDGHEAVVLDPQSLLGVPRLRSLIRETSRKFQWHFDNWRYRKGVRS